MSEASRKEGGVCGVKNSSGVGSSNVTHSNEQSELQRDELYRVIIDSLLSTYCLPMRQFVMSPLLTPLSLRSLDSNVDPEQEVQGEAMLLRGLCKCCQGWCRSKCCSSCTSMLRSLGRGFALGLLALMGLATRYSVLLGRTLMDDVKRWEDDKRGRRSAKSSCPPAPTNTIPS